jgi:hypothetical protein
MLSWLYFMFVTPTIPNTSMPYIPSVGDELSTTGAFAHPPIAALGGSSQYGYAGSLNRSPQH